MIDENKITGQIVPANIQEILDRFISTSETARRLRISRIAVLKRIYKGRINAFKIGRNYLVEVASLNIKPKTNENT